VYKTELSIGVNMSDKDFYLEHYAKATKEDVNPEAFAQAFRNPGHRYYCLHDFLKNHTRLSALELGMGSLSSAVFLSGFFSEYRAVDIAAKEILASYGDEVVFPLTDDNLNEDFAFPDGSFDVVVAMMVIEHLFDPFHSFREVSRVLKKDGIALINLPVVTSLRNRFRLMFGIVPVTSTKSWWGLEEWDGGHLHYFSIDLVTKLAERYGLKLERIYPVGNHIGLKNIFPKLLCNEASFILRKV